jgi:hypothetical protein
LKESPTSVLPKAAFTSSVDLSVLSSVILLTQTRFSNSEVVHPGLLVAFDFKQSGAQSIAIAAHLRRHFKDKP